MLSVPLAAAPREVAHRGADPSGEHESDRGRAGRETAAQLRHRVERAAQLLDRVGEPFAFCLDLALNLCLCPAPVIA